MGILYALIVGYIVCQKKNVFANLFILCVLSEFVFRRAYLLSIGESYLTLELCSQYLLIVFCIFNLHSINKKLLRSWFLLTFSYTIPILLLIVFPSSVLVASPAVTWDMVLEEGASLVHPQVTTHVITMTTKFVLFSLVFIYIYKNWHLKDYKWSITRFSKWCNFFICFGCIEFLLKNVFGLNETWGNVITFFFGERSSTIAEGRLRGDLYELTLFTQEASHYAYVLLFIAIIKLTDNIINNRRHKIDLYLFLTLLLMALSTSFSVIYMIASFFFIYLLYRWYIERPKYMRYEKIAFITAFLAVLSYLSVFLAMNVDSFVYSRLINLYENFDELLTIDYSFGSTMGDFSTQIRLVSMIQAVRAFLWRPIFGFSIGTIDAHSGTAMFLSAVGIFGLFCWIKFYFRVNPLFQILGPKRSLYYLAIVLFLFINLLSGSFRAFFSLTLFYFVVSCCFVFSEKGVVSNAK